MPSTPLWLTAAGADFVCADWQEISRQLSLLGVPA
ncbi:hypothetical protein ACVILI_000165 [Mesorhizobium sp. USDA 4775]